MTFLHTLLSYRLDGVLFAALTVAAAALCQTLVRRRRSGCRLGQTTWFIAGAFIIVGFAAAEGAGWMRSRSLQLAYTNLGTTYALELQKLGHAQIGPDTPPDDPVYLRIIEAQKNWLRVNPFISDIYTFRRHDDRRVVFIVDSETDYNRDGLFDGYREARTPIGEIYEETTEHFFAALRGETAFDATLESDRWGTWVSSLTPIYDDQGRIEAGVGIDYPAENWIAGVVSARALALAAMLILVAVFLSRETALILLRAETWQRRDTERALQQVIESVHRANHAKNELFAAMDNEFRTPLTAIFGFSNLLSETKLTPEQRRYLSTISTAGERLLLMLNALGDLRRIDEKRLILDRQPWSPARLIHELVEHASPTIVRKKLELRVEQNCPHNLSVEGDAPRVRQILHQLLDNAIKFTDRGHIRLAARWLPDDTGENGQLVFDIEDTGIGIPSRKLTALQNAFQETGALRAYAGAGLGLLLSRRLIGLMQGSFTIESMLEMGTHCTVSLPLRAIAESEPASSLATADAN